VPPVVAAVHGQQRHGRRTGGHAVGQEPRQAVRLVEDVAVAAAPPVQEQAQRERGTGPEAGRIDDREADVAATRRRAERAVLDRPGSDRGQRADLPAPRVAGDSAAREGDRVHQRGHAEQGSGSGAAPDDECAARQPGLQHDATVRR
jgi:hypothetical protein